MLAMALPRDADPSAILGWIAETPAFKRAARERVAAITAERGAQLRELRRLKTLAEIEAPKLADAIEKATAEKKKIETALRAVDARLGAAIVAKYNFGVDFGRRHDALEAAALRASASPIIPKFVSEMNTAWTKRGARN
jgi:hypothetical protein